MSLRLLHVWLILIVASSAAAPASAQVAGATARPGPATRPLARGALVADSFSWFACDYVVELFHNGTRVERGRRHLVEDIFGATGETARLEIREGDWLVFQLSSNQMRWGGARTFIGGATSGGAVRVPTAPTAAWTYCDDLSRVEEFIRSRDADAGRPVRLCEDGDLWRGGIERWHAAHRNGPRAQAIWGGERVTWVKLKLPRPAADESGRSVNALESWRPVRGRWSRAAGGEGVRGAGDSLAELRQRLKIPCEVRLTLTVEEGMRPRIHFPGTDIYLGNEGYHRTLAVFGAASQVGDPQPVAYKLGESVTIVARLDRTSYEIRIGDTVFTGAYGGAKEVVGVTLSGGDGWSTGTTRFGQLEVAELKAQEHRDAVPRPDPAAPVPAPAPATRPGSIFEIR